MRPCGTRLSGTTDWHARMLAMAPASAVRTYRRALSALVLFHLQAIELADGRGFIQPIAHFYLQGLYASAAHPPLFSMVLAIATRAVRVVGFTGNSARFHQCICALLSSRAVVAVAAAARRL